MLAFMAGKPKFTLTPSEVDQKARKFVIILRVLRDGEIYSHSNKQGVDQDFMTVSTLGTDNVRQDIVLFGEAFAKFRGLMTQGT